MTQALECTKCDQVILQVENPIDKAVCDIFAYHHIQHIREEIAQEIEAACHLDEDDDQGCLEICTHKKDAAIARGMKA